MIFNNVKRVLPGVVALGATLIAGSANAQQLIVPSTLTPAGY